MKMATKRIIARIMAVMMVVSILPFDMWGTANVVMAEGLSVTDDESLESVDADLTLEDGDVDTEEGGDTAPTQEDGSSEDASVPADDTKGGDNVSVPEEDAEPLADVEFDVEEAEVLEEPIPDESVIDTEQVFLFESLPSNGYFTYKSGAAINTSSPYTGEYMIKAGSKKDEKITLSGKALKTNSGGEVYFETQNDFEILVVFGAKAEGTSVGIQIIDGSNSATTMITTTAINPSEYVGTHKAGNITIKRTSGEGCLYYIAVIPAATKPATPTITPDTPSGKITEAFNVTLDCETADAEIYYTTDGTEPDPTDETQKYVANTNIEIKAEGTTKLRAVAVIKADDGTVTKSEELSRTYEYLDVSSTVMPPTEDADAALVPNEKGLVKKGAVIKLKTVTDGATIYYTTDGSVPEKDGDKTNEYTDAGITITDEIINPDDNKVTINAYAVKEGMTDSDTMTEPLVFTVQSLTAPTPNIKAGAVERGTAITLSNAVADAKIYYTTDSSAPTVSTGTEYNDGDTIDIKADTTIKAIAVHDEYASSKPATLNYTIEPSKKTRAGGVHNVTTNGVASDYFTIDSSLEVKDEEEANAVSYEGLNLTGYVELGTDSVTFTPAKAGTLVLVTDATDISSISVKAGATEVTDVTCESGVVTVELTADTEYTISNGTGTTKLYYMSVVYDIGEFKQIGEDKVWTFDLAWIKGIGQSESSSTYLTAGTKYDDITVGGTAKTVQTKPTENNLSIKEGGTIALPLQKDTEAVEIIVKLNSIGGNDSTDIRWIDIGEGQYKDVVYQRKIHGDAHNAQSFDVTSKEYKNSPYYLKSDNVFGNTLLITGHGGENKIESITLKEYKDPSLFPVELHDPVITPADGETLDISTGKITIAAADADKEISGGVDIYYTTDGKTPNKEDVGKTGAETNTALYSSEELNVADLIKDITPTPDNITIKAYVSKEGNYTDSAVVTAKYTLSDLASQVGSPTISINSAVNATGEVKKGAEITLEVSGKTDADDFSIYYTTDATQELDDKTDVKNLPADSKIKKYTAAIAIADDIITKTTEGNVVTIKAIAVDNAATNPKATSKTSERTYKVQTLAKPSVSFGNTDGVRGDEVTLVHDKLADGIKIRYTTDDSEPSATKGEEYTAPIIIKNDQTTIKAIAVDDAYVSSEVLTVTYTIKGSDANTAGAVHNFTTDGTKSSYFTFASALAVKDETTPVVYNGLDLTGYVDLGTDTVKFTTGEKAAKLTLKVDGESVSVKAGSEAAQSCTSTNGIVTLDLAAKTAYTISQDGTTAAKLYYVDVKDDRAGGTFIAKYNDIDPYFTYNATQDDKGKNIQLDGQSTSTSGRIRLADDTNYIRFTVFEGCTAKVEVFAASTNGSNASELALYKEGETPTADQKFALGGSTNYNGSSVVMATSLKGGATYVISNTVEQGAGIYYIRVTENKPQLGFKPDSEPKFTSTGNPDAPFVDDVLTLEFTANTDETRTPVITWVSVEKDAEGNDVETPLTADSDSDGKSYTVKAADKGKLIKATVTYAAADGNKEVTASCITEDAVTEYTFGFSANPKLTSSNEDATVLNPGDTLTLTYALNNKDTDLTDASVIKWERVTTAEDGTEETEEINTDATDNKKYTVDAEDVGSIIRVTVTPKLSDNTEGTAKSASSIAVTEVELEPLEFTTAPTLTISTGGVLTAPHVGDVLTLSYALSIEGEDVSDITWERVTTAEDGTEETEEINTDAADNKKYTVDAEDIGSKIRVTVTPELAEGNTGDAADVETGIVEVVVTPGGAVFKTLPSLTISAGGSLTAPHPTDVLTVAYEVEMDTDDTDASVIEWYRVSATAADAEPQTIANETGKTYTIKATDEGYKISAKVTPKTTKLEAGAAKETALTAAVTKKNDTVTSGKATIWVVGDSTVSPFNDKYYIPRQGYGEQIKNYFNADVYNLAHSGASSKDFTTMSEYTTLMNGAKDADGKVTTPKLGDADTEGKFLIIGFGHNDEKTEAARYTNPNGDYTTAGSFAKSLYDNYIKPALDAGVTPVVVTPIVRYAEANTVESYAGTAKAHVTKTEGSYEGGDYPKAIRDMCATLNANGENVILIDLTQATLDKNVAMGEQAQYMHAFTGAKWTDETKSEKVPVGRDDTHTNSFGAKMNAWLIAQLTKGTALNAYCKEGITEPTYEADYPFTINDAYTITDYSTPGDDAVTGSGWPVYTDASGKAWYGTAFGDTGGQGKITKLNEDGTPAELIHDYFDAVIGDDNSLTLSVANNAGKFAGSSEGFVFYYTKVRAGSNFTLSAKAKVNSFNSNNQVSYGLMARDDVYINTYISSTMGDFVAAGPLNATANDGKGKNCFGRKSGERVFGPDAAKGYVTEGDVLDLKIVGTSDGFTMTYGENEPVSAGFDYPLTSVDSDYIYVGMYVARNANVTFSDIVLDTEGALYPGDDPGPGPGPGPTPVEYTITVDKADESANAVSTFKVAEGEQVTVENLPTPTRTGYIFAGWTDENGTPITLPQTPTGDMTFKATWTQRTVDETKWSVLVDKADGTVPTELLVVKDSEITDKELPDPERAGYTFAGWVDETGTAITLPYKPTADMTIKATWTKNAPVKFTITVDKADGSAVSIIEVVEGEQVTIEMLPNPTRDDYTFNGWKDGQNKVVTVPFTPTADMTITATWKSNNGPNIDDSKLLDVVLANEDEEYIYTGAAIKPAIIVTNYGRQLVEGVDYTVKYSNNVKVSTAAKKAKLTVTGKGSLSGADSIDFEIKAKNIASNDIAVGGAATVEGEDVVYVLKGSKLNLVMYDGGVKLGSKDFTTNAGKDKITAEKTVTITGGGNYTGTRTIKVSPQEKTFFQKVAITSFTAPDITYDGEEHYLDTTKDIKVTGTEGTDYTLVYSSDVVNAGKVKVTVVGMGKYTGAVTKAYTIKPIIDKTGAKINVTGVNAAGYPYVSTGVTIGDDLTVTYTLKDGTIIELEEGKDYKIAYSGNKKAGATAKYTITGIGNFKGSKKTGEFKVNKAVLTNDDITDGTLKIAVADKIFVKDGIYKSVPYVSLNDVLVKNSEYTVSYQYNDKEMDKKTNPIKLTDANPTAEVTVTIKGKDKNFSGTASATYTVRKPASGTVDISKAKIVVYEGTVKGKVEYTGKERTPQIGITPKGAAEIKIDPTNEAQLAEYGLTVDFINNIYKGTATVVLNADGTGTKTKLVGGKNANFKIVAYSLKNKKTLTDLFPKNLLPEFLNK